MDIRNTFKVAQEIATLAKKYDDQDADSIVDILDMLHSKLLLLGQYASDKLINKEGATTKTYEALQSHSKITVYYVYENEQLALVEDTAMELHLVPLDIIKF